MRKIRIIYCLLASFLLALPLPGVERLRERVFLTTDRDVYVAGDNVWVSAWCMDAATGRLSGFSKTAYVEVHSPDGMVQTAKVSLDGGRGAARLTLPTTLPTGNYRILAYTRLGASETGFDPLPGARTVSVFNTLSTERADGVTVAAEAPQGPAAVQAGDIQVLAGDASPGSSGMVYLTNNGTETVRISLSVRHDDGIPAPQGARVGDFIRDLRSLPAPQGFDDSVIPEYEGEIIHARVSGTDAEGLRAVRDKYAFLSSPGSGENLYTESISRDGEALFFTSNIYGQQEMFLEIEQAGDHPCHMEIVSPFLDLPAGRIPGLTLTAGYARALELRSLGMQLEKNFDADTLYTALPARQHQLFDGRECIRYELDDYTRFPLMEEVFVEIIPQLHTRRIQGRRQIGVLMPDNMGGYRFEDGNTLVLLDGVPVLDHEKILAYDPMLVRTVEIYPQAYFLGIRGFNGVVNFVTYKGTLPALAFEDNVRIIDFQGCSLPLAYTCEGVGGDYPDYRQTIYWHPLLTLEPGRRLAVEIKTPAYSGRFEAVAEGLTESGEAVAARTTLDVR